MKRLATVALGLAITIPLCAQRGAGHAGAVSHGGGISHSAPAFRGSYAPSASMRYRGAPVSRTPYASPYAARPRPPMPRFAAPTSRYVTLAPPARRPAFYQNQNHHPGFDRHHPFIRTFPIVGYFPPALFAPDYFGEPFYDNSFYDDSSAYAQPDYVQPDYADNTYPQSGPEGYAPYPQTPYPDTQYPQQQYPQAQYPDAQYPQPQTTAITPQMQYVPGSSDIVTLIFKDGRPPEQIQNYIATRQTLTVINGNRHREIPIADLDIPATIKANRETGVGFQLPASATP